MGLRCSRRLRRESSSGGKHQEISIPISEVDKILVCTIEQLESARNKLLKPNGDKMGDLEAESLRAEEVAAGESSSGTELKDNNYHLLGISDEAHEIAKVDTEVLIKGNKDLQENEALQHEMQEIETELAKEEALRNATKQAVEVKSCETEALRGKLECLKTKHQDLKRENDQLKTQTDAIELHHDGLRKEIQSFRDRSKTLSDLKADMKTIKKEQKALLNLGETMARDLRRLQRVHSEMQPVTKQIQSNRSQNIYLRKWIVALSDQIRTETRLSDKLNAVKAQYKDLSDQRDASLEMLEKKDKITDLIKELRTNTSALEIERQNIQPQYQEELLVADPECNGMTNDQKEKALKAKEDTVSRENEALQHEMQEIETELEKATKQAVEVKSCETEALREKLECLKTKHQDLKRENDNVKESIKELELQREFKDSYLELEAFENELRAEYKVLMKTHAEVHERVLKEEQWKDKHDQLKRQTDAIELHNDGLRKEIQSFRDRPKTLSDLKADVKTLKKEKKALFNLAESMTRELRSFKKVHSEMQPVEKEVQSIESQNIHLKQWIVVLCEQIRIRTETRLSDELNAVHAENNDLSDQRDASLQMLEEKKDSRSQS